MCRAGLSQGAERVLDLGPKGARRRLQVVYQGLAVGERRAALVDGIPQLSANRLELGSPPRRAQAIGLGIDGGGR